VSWPEREEGNEEEKIKEVEEEEEVGKTVSGQRWLDFRSGFRSRESPTHAFLIGE